MNAESLYYIFLGVAEAQGFEVTPRADELLAQACELMEWDGDE